MADEEPLFLREFLIFPLTKKNPRFLEGFPFLHTAPISRILCQFCPMNKTGGSHLSGIRVTSDLERHSRTPTLPSSFLCQLIPKNLRYPIVSPVCLRNNFSERPGAQWQSWCAGTALHSDMYLAVSFLHFCRTHPCGCLRISPRAFLFATRARMLRADGRYPLPCSAPLLIRECSDFPLLLKSDCLVLLPLYHAFV